MLQVARIVCFSGMATAMVWCLIWAVVWLMLFCMLGVCWGIVWIGHYAVAAMVWLNEYNYPEIGCWNRS